MKRHNSPQFELPGAQEAFNLAGQCQHTPQGVKTAPAKPQEQPALFPESPRPEGDAWCQRLRNETRRIEAWIKTTNRSIEQMKAERATKQREL